MNILGYSGLNKMNTAHRELQSSILAIPPTFIQGMDAAACLIIDGKIIAAAEEERFINEKHTCNFPVNAIQYCLNKANMVINDLDYICHGFDFSKFKEIYSNDEYSRELYAKILSPTAQIQWIKTYFPNSNIEKKFVPIQHHIAHAASAYYPSNYQDALILVADGLGEIHSVSVFQGRDNEINLLANYDLLSSIGMLYSLVTLHLGFSPNHDEYKVMGLAPYGNPEVYKSVFDELVILDADGEIFIPRLLDNNANNKFEYAGFRDYLAESLCLPRDPSAEIGQIHKDIAASLQVKTNEALMHILQYWQQQTRASHLCMAGGVALNCVTNGVLQQSKLFKQMYIQPAAGDAGTALGAALHQFYQNKKQQRYYYSSTELLPFYGPSVAGFNEKDIYPAHKEKIHITELPESELLTTVATLIAADKVVAWMQGQMEYGPRALGNRSILANPLNPKMRDIVNSMVKKRESFRPFAPSVKRDAVHNYFQVHEGAELPYMLIVCKVRDEYVLQLPAITHVDNTARVQTADENDHPRYWRLLDAFEKITGYPILLNTSFNLKGQAIIIDANEGINTFLNTSIDVLVIDRYLITKKQT